MKRPRTEKCCVIGCKYYLWNCLPAINPLQRSVCHRLVCVLYCFPAVSRLFISPGFRIPVVCQSVCNSKGRREYFLPWTGRWWLTFWHFGCFQLHLFSTIFRVFGVKGENNEIWKRKLKRLKTRSCSSSGHCCHLVTELRIVGKTQSGFYYHFTRGWWFSSVVLAVCQIHVFCKPSDILTTKTNSYCSLR